MRVLDVGGGLGGPARTLAHEFGCHVTVVDLAASYVETGRLLTSLLGLDDPVRFLVGDALELPPTLGTFDVVWTQNSGMNIEAKERLYAGFRRVLAPKGRLATQEPMSGPVQPPVYPLMWATDPSTDFLRPPEAMRRAIEAAGLRTLVWEEVVPARQAPVDGSPTRPALSVTVQGLVMGDGRLAEIAAAARRNEAERRTIMVHATFEATAEDRTA